MRVQGVMIGWWVGVIGQSGCELIAISGGDTASNCSANFGPMVAKKELMWSDVSFGLIGEPVSSFS